MCDKLLPEAVVSLLVIALPVAVVVGLVLVAVLGRRPALTVGVNEHPELVRVARHARGWRSVGLVAGLAAGAALLLGGERVDGLGRLTALAPAAVGAGVLLGTVVGELTARPRVGVRRSAVVETRTVGGTVPRARLVLLAVAATLLGGLLGIGAAWGSPDDLGRAGRSWSTTCTAVVDGAASLVGSSRGPWPGSFYAVPLAVGLVVVLALVVAGLAAVVRRPRPAVESRGLDSTLRRWSAGSVLTAGAFAVLGTLAPVAAFMASALTGSACALSGAETLVRVACLVLAPLALVGAAAMLGLLLVAPTIRVDDLPRPLPGDAAPVGAPVR